MELSIGRKFILVNGRPTVRALEYYFKAAREDFKIPHVECELVFVSALTAWQLERGI